MRTSQVPIWVSILTFIATVGLASWTMRRGKEYWRRAARTTGLLPVPKQPRQRIATNLQWFMPYIAELRDTSFYTTALGELEGVQHHRDTSLAMYEIHHRVWMRYSGTAYFCVQRFRLRLAIERLFVVSPVTPFMQLSFQLPAGLRLTPTAFEVTVAFSDNDHTWKKIEPIWRAYQDFCTKQKMGLFIEDGYIFFHSPYRPIDLELWGRFIQEVLDAIDTLPSEPKGETTKG